MGVVSEGGGADPSERKKMMVSRRQAREMARPQALGHRSVLS